jgi:hypothetical protein
MRAMKCARNPMPSNPDIPSRHYFGDYPLGATAEKIFVIALRAEAGFAGETRFTLK